MRRLLLLLLCATVACASMQGRARLGGRGGGSVVALSVLGLADFTAIGAFEPPNCSGSSPANDIDFGSGLALRRVSGVDYLYATCYGGGMVEFTVPADGDLEAAAPFTTATATGQYGDIFGTTCYQSVVSDGGSGGPKEGLAQDCRPLSLYWRESESRMYWTHLVSYENDSANKTIGTSSVANPTVITTTSDHGINNGERVEITSHAGSTPAISGLYTATVTGATTFTIPVNVSSGGTGGTVVSTSDNALGYSTLNFGAKTGAGVGIWKLSRRATGTYTDGMTNVGNRWVTGLTDIPSGFATTYLSGKDFGVGCGDPGLSIAPNGPISMGPSLFAMDTDDLNVGQDRAYFNGTMQKLIFHPFSTIVSAPLRKLRPTGLPVNVSQGSADPNYDASTLYTSWADRIGGCQWIRGANKEGFVVPAIGPTGTMNTTISASPTPTNTVFTVSNIGDTAIGDRIFFETVETKDQSPYDCAYAIVSGVSGQQLTVGTATNCQTGATDTTIAFAGGYALAGTKYVGGGNKSSRMRSMFYIYSAAQLALSAAGSITASAIQATNEGVKDFPGQSWPVRAQDTMKIFGTAYGSVTCRYYLGMKDVPTIGALISVWSVAC